jgi:hypothetical protein
MLVSVFEISTFFISKSMCYVKLLGKLMMAVTKCYRIFIRWYDLLLLEKKPVPFSVNMLIFIVNFIT